MPDQPQAKTVPFTFEHLGRTFSDPYTWLQDKDDPEVIAYLEAENAYKDELLKHTDELQETLFQEMRGRMAEDDKGVPERRGEYYYYWRIAEGQQYPVYCRKYGSEDGEEQVLVDENVIAEGYEYTNISSFEPSPDNRYLAYTVDTTGALVYTLHVLDMETGEEIITPIDDVAWSIEWASDNKTLFYTIFDDSHRAYQVWRIQINSDDDPVMIWQEDDASYSVGVYRSGDGEYMFVSLQSSTTSEVHYFSAHSPTDDLKIIHPRQHWMEYYVAHHGGRFLVLSNEDAENFKLMEAPISNPSKDNWKVLIEHRDDVLMRDLETFKDHIVFYERKNGLQQIRITTPDDIAGGHYIEYPEPVYAVYGGNNPEYDTQTLRFSYNSLVTPYSVVDYDMQTREWDVRKRQDIPSGYDGDQYESARLFAPADDGSQIPISLVYRKGLNLDGQSPLVLYAYGSYGYSTEPTFSTSRLSLLDRGYVWAIAHVRGGSEMGRYWYEQGRLMDKKNTFTDFIACADHLIAEGYTSKEKLGILGGSAGGLLVSAVMNLRPDLCHAVGAMVPFTNVITAMLDPDLPLTVVEWEQWGNPQDEEAFDYMLSYSPYENVAEIDYPNVYVKTGLNDLQVPYWDPAKWVAKLREKKTDDNKVVMSINMGAGHGGSSGRYDSLKETAELYVFFIDTLGTRIVD